MSTIKLYTVPSLSPVPLYTAVPSTLSWAQQVKDRAQMDGSMTTCLGWKRHIRQFDEFQPRSVMNWPVQSAGSEIMRLVVTLAVDAGIRLCMPVHDGFLISSTAERLDADIAKMQAIMSWAGKLVTGGLEIRVDCKVVNQLSASPTNA